MYEAKGPGRTFSDADARQRRGIRVVVADQQKLRRELLLDFLGAQSGMAVIGGLAHGAEAARMVRSLKPEVLVVSSSLPDMSGTELAAEVHTTAPATITVVLCDKFDRDFRRLARSSDVKVLRPASCSLRNLLRTIRAVRATAPLPTRRPAEAEPGTVASELELTLLSPREHQILKLVGDGDSNREIAAELGISVRTVEVHKTNIKSKLSLRGSHDLILAAISAPR